jgi:hypothetical protein
MWTHPGGAPGNESDPRRVPERRGLQRDLHDGVHKNHPSEDSGESVPVADRTSRGGSVGGGSAGVVELGYTAVLRTAARKGLGVRIPPPALATPVSGGGAPHS